MSRHILVVDDEAQICELLTVYLTRRGYEVSTASDSAGMAERLAAEQIDLVVLDIGLVREDGLNLLPWIKSRYQNTMVVMMTGMGIVEDLLAEAHQKGADGYVSKAVPMTELLMAIERIFGPGTDAAAAA